MDNDLARILDELTVMRAESRETLVTMTRIEEQVKDVGDHEARIRVMEQNQPNDAKLRITSLEQNLPENANSRLTSLEHWRYGLPITGLVGVGSMILSGWTAMRGA